MRTTLDLDDALARAAKQRALDDGTTLTAVIERALARYLGPPAPSTGFRLSLITVAGRVLPGVDLADRDALYERMEQDR